MNNTKQNTFLLTSRFEKSLSLGELIEVTDAYHNSVKNSNFCIPTDNTFLFMLSAKRDKITFGPYQNLSFFEISNRIYSDLVLLEAAKILFKEHKIKSIKLKMSNLSGNDLTIIDKDNNEIVGEAFNTAQSFFQIKMRSELKKYENNKIGVMAFNSCALDDKNKVFLENKKMQYPQVLFIKCTI